MESTHRFPQSLEIALRFPHSHSFDDEGGWKSGKPKPGFPLSHRPDALSLKQKQTAAGYRRRPNNLYLPHSATFSLRQRTGKNNCRQTRVDSPDLLPARGRCLTKMLLVPEIWNGNNEGAIEHGSEAGID
jgi:hypothetical protein